MRVYITYEKDGYGGEQVDLVFANEAEAQDHVISNKFLGNAAYVDMERHELKKKASEHITLHYVHE